MSASDPLWFLVWGIVALLCASLVAFVWWAIRDLIYEHRRAKRLIAHYDLLAEQYWRAKRTL